MSKETKIKMSEAKTGKKNPMYGKKLSDERRIKISERFKGENHPLFGKHLSDSTKQKIKNALIGQIRTKESRQKLSLSKKAEKNPNWQEIPSYNAVHLWINRNYSKPELCQVCAKIPPKDLANVSGKYLRKVDDWLWLCRRCHMNLDGRLFTNKWRNVIT